jgi:hypothetical protein
MQSGDVYTFTDLQLLAALAQCAETQLVRLDSEGVIREARDLQRSLQRYVPGAVAGSWRARRISLRRSST